MSTPKNKWQPKLDKKCNLKGPYPEVIDLCSETSLDLDFELDPMIIISNDEHVKKIIAPSNQIGISYISIMGMPNLEEVVIVGMSSKFSRCLQWVEIDSCPSLKRITLEGDIVSLSVTGQSSLDFLDIRGCKDIDYVDINQPTPGIKVDARGCVKLREVIGFDEEITVRSGLKTQILDNQRLSRQDGRIHESMTFTDLDGVKSIINDGVKALSRMGRIYTEDSSILGYYGLKALDDKFVPFDYRILMPLEPVYTGGTGETYAYVSVQSEIEPDGIRISKDEVAGNSSPEECLEYSLHTIRMRFGNMPQIDSATNNELLELLQNASTSNDGREFSGIPIFVSSLIASEKQAELKDLALESGINIATDKDEIYAFVHSSTDYAPEEETIQSSALFDIDESSALDQLKVAWYWRFKGKTICLSGKAARGNKKKEYEALIKSSDFKLVNEICRGLSYLVHEDPDSTGGKVAQAKKLGIKVISEEELRSILMSKDISN